MSEKKKNNFLLQGGVLAIAGLVTRFIGMIYRVPLTRIVGKEGMTYYSTAYDIYNLALLVSTYSIPVSVSKLVADKDSQGQYINSNKIFRVGMALSGCIGFVVSAIIFIFAGQLAEFMGYPDAKIPLRMLAPTIFVFSIMGIIRGFFQGKKTMIPTAVSQIIEQIFNAVFSIVAAILFIKANVDNANVAAYGAAGGTAGTLIGAIFGLIFLGFIYYINSEYFTRKCLKDHTGIIDEDRDIVKQILLTMLPIILSQTIYQLSGIIDNFMFSSIMEGKGVDVTTKAVIYESYTNRYKLLYNLPVAIASAFGVSIVPTLSSAFKVGDIESVKQKIASSVKLNMIIAIPSAFGLSFLAKPILVLLFNDTEDILSFNLMTLGGIAVVFFALSTLTNGVLQSINRLRVPVIHAAISLAVHIPIIIILVKVFDLSVYGMVIGNVTYALLVCILNWITINDALDYRQEIKTTFIVPAVSGLVMGVASLLVYKFFISFIPSNTIVTLIAILFAVLVYFALLILLKGVTKEELKGFPKGDMLVRIACKLHLMK